MVGVGGADERDDIQSEGLVVLTATIDQSSPICPSAQTLKRRAQVTVDGATPSASQRTATTEPSGPDGPAQPACDPQGRGSEVTVAAAGGMVVHWWR